MPPSLHSIRFPGESPAYRDARDQLLLAEMALRKNIEEVAALRRELPLGGPIPEDYLFEEGSADINDSAGTRKTRLSELFSPGKDTLVIYSYMFGPQMQAPCVSCTSILDGLNGAAPHIRQRVNFAVVANSPIARIRETARGRGWNNLRLLSSANNTYNRDYHGESPKGDQLPSLNVFTRRDGKICHFYNTELLFAPPEKGMDGRHVDSIWPIWNMFDFTPEGRGTDWYPRLSYETPGLHQVKTGS
jgi:predicted dithiol-disulfide oxidoreductase (DUF899 family)